MEIKKLDDDLWVFRIEGPDFYTYTYFLRYKDKIYFPSLTRDACKLVFVLRKRVKTKFKNFILNKYCQNYLSMEKIKRIKLDFGIYLNTEEILGWK